MRVVYVIDGLDMGGAERNTLSLMAELMARGVECRLVTLSEAGDGGLAAVARQMKVTPAGLGARHLADAAAIGRFTGFIREFRPQIIHLQDPYANPLGVIAKRFAIAKVVMTRHVLVDPDATVRDRLRSALLSWCARHGTDAAIALADALVAPLVQQTGIERSRVTVIRSGISMGSVAPPTWQGADGSPVLLMIAVMRPGKGHALMIRSFERVLQAVPTTRLRLVGDGPLRPELEGLASPYGAAVEFLGERTDIPELIAASHVAVLPSESEALPISLMEVAAGGRPVIATRVGGVPEIVKDGVTGLLIAPNDAATLVAAAIRLLSDPPRRCAMGQAARAHAEQHFSIARQATETLNLYRRLSAPIAC
jgi:glycosyltransferase involved in cell wall biosynthesis